MWGTTSSTLKDGNWYADDDTISYPQLTIKVISSRPRRDDFFFIINKIPTFVNPVLTTGSARRSRHSCTPSQRRSSLHPATLVSAPRCVRLCSQQRLYLLPRALTVGIGVATLQGDDARTCGEGLGRSTVAHFARKVRGTNIGAAKHGLKIQQSHAPERWSCSLRVRGPHFASKVSYNAGAATDDCAGQRKSPLRGHYRQLLIFLF